MNFLLFYKEEAGDIRQINVSPSYTSDIIWYSKTFNFH